MKRLDDHWQQKKRSTNVHQFLKSDPSGNAIKTSGKIVDQNADGTKPSRGVDSTVSLVSGGGNVAQSGKTRYLGRMAVTSSKTAYNKIVPTRYINILPSIFALILQIILICYFEKPNKRNMMNYD